MNSIPLEYISTLDCKKSDNLLGLQFNVYKTTSQIEGDEYTDISDIILPVKHSPLITE
ncbi:MAG: hypothetical protein JRJ85_08555 [Deltaproteobacteria bacterium]|nr:hypothetical protein [Deltaproteobacteria bacterium]